MGELFELTETEEQILERLEKRIPYNERKFGTKTNYELILEDIIISARNLALSRVFPFYDYSNKELPLKYANWQYRCAIEIYNLNDKTGFITYSENGLSFGKTTDGISQQLLDEIMPKVGIPTSEVEDELGN